MLVLLLVLFLVQILVLVIPLLLHSLLSRAYLLYIEEVEDLAVGLDFLKSLDQKPLPIEDKKTPNPYSTVRTVTAQISTKTTTMATPSRSC